MRSTQRFALENGDIFDGRAVSVQTKTKSITQLFLTFRGFHRIQLIRTACTHHSKRVTRTYAVLADVGTPPPPPASGSLSSRPDYRLARRGWRSGIAVPEGFLRFKPCASMPVGLDVFVSVLTASGSGHHKIPEIPPHATVSPVPSPMGHIALAQYTVLLAAYLTYAWSNPGWSLKTRGQTALPNRFRG